MPGEGRIPKEVRGGGAAFSGSQAQGLGSVHEKSPAQPQPRGASEVTPSYFTLTTRKRSVPAGAFTSTSSPAR